MRAALFIALCAAAVMSVPIWHLQPPLSVSPSGGIHFAAARHLSEPALAGQATFGARCAGCHGAGGEGSAQAPGLLDRAYAVDFRDSAAFHDALGRGIQAHRHLLETAHADGRLGFNQLELMAKFLREMRQLDVPPAE